VELRVASQNNIATCKHVLQWKEAGADTLTLGRRLSRNFGMLEAVVALAKQLGVKLRLNANSVCMPDCIYMNSHMSTLAHSGDARPAGSAPSLDYNLMQCTFDKLSSPSKLMSTSWIRPEDVRCFEDVCDKAGFDGFGIVLLDGWKSTAFLSRVIAAYTARSFDGNLVDLLCLPELEGQAATERAALSPQDRFFRLPELRIDNKVLDGFIQPFVDGLLCGEKMCAGGGNSSAIDGMACDHCATWAERAMSANASDFAGWKAHAVELLESIKTSRMFGAQ
jgi:hypothetical protein